MPEIREEYGYIEGTYAALYRPSASPAGTVVIVPAIGDERRSLVRAEVELSRNIAAEGMLAVRFDFSGDGSSTRLRTMDNCMADLAAVWKLVTGKVTVVAFRAGLCLFGRFLTAGHKQADIFAIGPVSGAEFMREASRRAGLRSMMTEGAAISADTSQGRDLGGDVYGADFEKDISQPLTLKALDGRFLAVDIGPQKSPRKSAADIVSAFLGAGMKPAKILQKAPDLIDGVVPGVINWRHPVIWGEVEHSGVRPLERMLLDFLGGKE
jgi:hypothetical protein